MDYFFTFLAGAMVGIVLFVVTALVWIYAPDDVPPAGIVFEHLRGMRAIIRILRINSDALAQMLAAVRRQR